MNIELMAIGSELLLGQIVDTNSAWLAQRLAEAGANLFYKTTVGDNLPRITQAIGAALERSDCLITGGGLGPTEDDLTREAVAAATGRALVTNPQAVTDLQERFRSRGFILTANNEKQTLVPRGALLVRNPNGTAPSFIVDTGKKVVACLPGVPFELKWLVDNELLPWLRRRFDLRQAIYHRVLKVGEIGESAVDDAIGDMIRDADNPRIGLLARPGQVDVRISARGDNETSARRMMEPVEAELRRRLGDNVFAVDGQTLEQAVGDLLRRRHDTVACVEDASGGAVCAAISEAAGDLFQEAAVVSPGAAAELLARAGMQLPETGIERAVAMAQAVRNLSNASVGIAAHSVPAPGSQEVNLARGDTYVAVVGVGEPLLRHVRSAGRSVPDRNRAAMHALSALRRALLGAHTPG